MSPQGSVASPKPYATHGAGPTTTLARLAMTCKTGELFLGRGQKQGSEKNLHDHQWKEWKIIFQILGSA